MGTRSMMDQMDQMLIDGRMQKYPTLYHVLGGSKWIRSRVASTPNWPDLHPVIRWISRDEQHPFLRPLETCLQTAQSLANDTSSRDGYKELLTHLRSNTGDF